MDSYFVSMEYAVLLLPLYGLAADAQLHAGERWIVGQGKIILDGSR